MIKESRENQIEKLVETIIQGVQEVKGNEIVCLDLRNITHSVADYFIICHGNSDTQVDSIAKAVERETETKLNESPTHKEGFQNSEWILLDYFNVVVHVFHKDLRSFYDLEELWADAKVERIENRA